MILADFLWDVFEKEHGFNGLNGYGTDFNWEPAYRQAGAEPGKRVADFRWI